MAKDAITMFKEAAAQLQKEIEYVTLDSARKMNDEDEALQELIGQGRREGGGAERQSKQAVQ